MRENFFAVRDISDIEASIGTHEVVQVFNFNLVVVSLIHNF